jgi:hypothetical protein
MGLRTKTTKAIESSRHAINAVSRPRPGGRMLSLKELYRILMLILEIKGRVYNSEILLLKIKLPKIFPPKNKLLKYKPLMLIREIKRRVYNPEILLLKIKLPKILLFKNKLLNIQLPKNRLLEILLPLLPPAFCPQTNGR